MKQCSHAWHCVETGEYAPTCVKSIIEIPKGSKGKYELDKNTGPAEARQGLVFLSTLSCNYGFIPQTYCDDHDPLDILVICSIDVFPMCIVDAKVIGVMEMIDGEERDDK